MESLYNLNISSGSAFIVSIPLLPELFDGFLNKNKASFALWSTGAGYYNKFIAMTTFGSLAQALGWGTYQLALR